MIKIMPENTYSALIIFFHSVVCSLLACHVVLASWTNNG